MSIRRIIFAVLAFSLLSASAYADRHARIRSKKEGGANSTGGFVRLDRCQHQLTNLIALGDYRPHEEETAALAICGINADQLECVLESAVQNYRNPDNQGISPILLKDILRDCTGGQNFSRDADC